MTGFDLPTNYLDDPEVLLKNAKASLKKVLTLELEDNRIRRSLTPEFEAMANKTLHEFSTPTTTNIQRTANRCWREWIRAQAGSHQHGAS
jgi:3-methyladenine DNA glycosylase Mpg